MDHFMGYKNIAIIENQGALLLNKHFGEETFRVQ